MGSWKALEGQVIDRLEAESPRVCIWVRDRVNLRSDNDVRLKSREELLEMFPTTVKVEGVIYRSLNDKALLWTLVWQTWLQIQSQEMHIMQGNIRSFWYGQLEPLLIDKELLYDDVGSPVRFFLPELPEYELSRNDSPEEIQRKRSVMRDLYLQDTISEVLGEFVKQEVFTFREGFGFADPREDFRLIGRRRPRLVMMTEKEGLWWLCEYANEKHGISAIASSGESSLLAMEYLVRELREAKSKAVDRVASIELGALTDYDPWGHVIAENVRLKLSLPVFFGDKVELTVLDGTREQLERIYDNDEKQLRRFRRDLSKYNQKSKGTQIEAWLAKTGGGICFPNDKPGVYFGMHIDTAKVNLLKRAVDEWVESVT